MPAMTESGLKPYMRPVPEPAANGVAELVVPTGEGTAIHLISAGQARGMLRRLSEGLADCVKGEGTHG